MRSISFVDARLSGRYAGPEDSEFRRDTLKRLFPQGDPYGFGSLYEVKYNVFSTLRLHDQATPTEAAARALEVIDKRPPHTKELRAVAVILGVDRQSARATGQALLEACEAVFAEEYKSLEAKREEALEDGRPIFLVALGDAARLAEAQSAGTPLSVLSLQRSASSGQLSASEDPGAAAETDHPADSDGSGSWETASLDSPPAEDPVSPRRDAMRLLGELQAAATRRRNGRSFVADRADHLGAGRMGGGRRHGRYGGAAGSWHDSGSDEDEPGALPRELRGITPLHLAVIRSDIPCIQVLLKDAQERGGAEGLQALLDAPIDRTAADGPWGPMEGLPALHLALSVSDERTVKMLLEAGATMARTRQGESPLHMAVLAACKTEWEPWRLQVLLDLGADKVGLNELSEADGRSPLHLLVDSGELELVEMLLEAGADLNLKMAEMDGGHSALHRAVTVGDVSMVELLLERGADVRARNVDNQTPAQLAEELGDDQLADLLQVRQRLQRLQSHGRQGAGGSACFRSPVSHEDVPEDLACAVCISRPKATILAPCGHRCLCKRCLRTIMERERDQRNCPVCREHIESFVVNVYE